MKIKKLFQTPKRTALTLIILILSIGAVFAVSAFTVLAIAENSSIGEETALSNAYTDAGFTPEQIDASRTKFKFDDGCFVYDIEFYVDGAEYEYTVKSSDGTIIEADFPDEHISNKTTIGINKAKEIVISHAGVSAENATFTKVKSEFDDGKQIYEIKFHTADKKYEYEISAADGSIIGTEVKSTSSSNNVTIPSEFITMEVAKNSALSHAGLTEATFTKAKLSKDDNIYKYEINFISDNQKYEYELDAVSGEVIKYEIEPISTEDDIVINDKTEITPPKDVIDTETAKSVAISHAAVEESDIVFTESKLSKEDGVYIYKIEFKSSDMEYEYDINAIDGTIIKFKSELTDNNSENTQMPSEDKFIGLEAAKNKALDKAAVSADDVIFTKAKLEKDGATVEYEIEFVYNESKYEFSIDAITGSVTEWKIEN